MGNVIVRATEAKDLPRISDLTQKVFGIRRDVELLSWLLDNPRSPGQIGSWIAERNGEIVGHAAVLKSRYRAGGRTLTGAHAFLWMVDPTFRGHAGMRLGAAVLGHGEFLIILGGTSTTQAILASRRFTRVGEAREYGFFTEPATVGQGGFDLVPWHDTASAAAPLPSGILANEAAPEHLEWLAACPELETHLYALERRGRHLGPVLLFVNRRESPAAGRIVHLPYLGDDPRIWLEGLATLGRELVRLGCRSWTALASLPALAQACEAAGAELAGSRPVWIKGNGQALATPSWHLTYLEGDLAYRRVRSVSPQAVICR